MSIFVIAIGFLSAYYAGKLSAARDINKIDNIPTKPHMILIEGLLVAISLYYSITLYGIGINY